MCNEEGPSEKWEQMHSTVCTDIAIEGPHKYRLCVNAKPGLVAIRLMRVPLQPIRMAGSLRYRTGSWKEAILYQTVCQI